MGSILSTNKNSQQLADDIKSTVTDLSYNRYQWWLDENNCMKLELFYKDKLMNFSKDIIVGTTYTIGIPAEGSYSKKELCQRIINHYKKRVELMKVIFEGVNKTQQMIQKINDGEICIQVDRFVDNWNQCKQYNGGWISKNKFQELLQKIKDTKKYERYYSVVERFEINYYKFLVKLHEFLYRIKEDIDNSMSDEEFNALDKEIRLLVDRMVSKCESLYLIATALLDPEVKP